MKERATVGLERILAAAETGAEESAATVRVLVSIDPDQAAETHAHSTSEGLDPQTDRHSPGDDHDQEEGEEYDEDRAYGEAPRPRIRERRHAHGLRCPERETRDHTFIGVDYDARMLTPYGDPGARMLDGARPRSLASGSGSARALENCSLPRVSLYALPNILPNQ